MIGILGFIAASAAATAMMDMETDRVAYNNCLVDFTTEHLDLKTGTRDFKTAAKDACANERNSYISSIKRDELEFGSTESEATTYATEEADNVLYSYTDGYANYASSNTRPVREE